MREKVNGGAAEERHRRHDLELCAGVAERLLEAERKQHDAGDHREVEERKRVARDLVLLLPGPRVLEPAGGHERHEVEVERPQCRGNRDSQHRGRDHPGVDPVLGADADRHDRLAERDDDDQAVALGEVTGLELPAPRPEQRRATHVDGERGDPEGPLDDAVGGRGEQQQAHGDGGAHGEAPDGLAQPALALVLATARDEEEDYLRYAHDGVGSREHEGGVAECLGHAQRHHEQARHGAEDRVANGALLGVDDAREPGVADPRPPQHGEHEDAACEALPGRGLRHERRALRQGEHEDEVEEELERRDPLLSLAPQLRRDSWPVP